MKYQITLPHLKRLVKAILKARQYGKLFHFMGKIVARCVIVELVTAQIIACSLTQPKPL
jgi:hypothetical protein